MTRFDRGKRLLVVACMLIAAGIGLAGSLTQWMGGAVLLTGWVLAIVALHRLGRAGSDEADAT